MRVSYSDRYYVDVPEGHRFPVKKYRRVLDRLLAEGTLAPSDVVEPEPARDEDLLLVHTGEYLGRLTRGELTEREVRRIGLPWSPALVARARAAVGGTLEAARRALEEGASANLAGGTHHAFPDRGEAFCVLNDMAVTIRALRRDGLIRRAAIVDCDVHQGNANAEIFAGDPDTFTFSMHGAGNYPLFKTTSSIDIELPRGTGDDAYLEALDSVLPGLLDRFRPDVVLYQAGVDVHENDALGTLALTLDGVARRDRHVLECCLAAGVPVAATMGGGYGRDLDLTVEAHCNTIRVFAAAARARVTP